MISERLQNLSRETGVEVRVHFLGHVSYVGLPRWYNTCDLFIIPNRDINGNTEGFGLAFLEAAASGKPAIAGKAGRTASAVVDEETGLRVDSEQVEDITKAVARLLLNPEEAEKMRNNARERVLPNFTHERRVNQLWDLVLAIKMKPLLYWRPLSKNDTAFYKGVGILLIVLHNYGHWVVPKVGQNDLQLNSSHAHHRATIK